jgi:hypothetical protein
LHSLTVAAWIAAFQGFIGIVANQGSQKETFEIQRAILAVQLVSAAADASRQSWPRRIKPMIMQAS